MHNLHACPFFEFKIKRNEKKIKFGEKFEKKQVGENKMLFFDKGRSPESFAKKFFIFFGVSLIRTVSFGYFRDSPRKNLGLGNTWEIFGKCLGRFGKIKFRALWLCFRVVFCGCVLRLSLCQIKFILIGVILIVEALKFMNSSTITSKINLN